MAVISRTHGYLFLQVPRTASSAVADNVLVPRLAGERIPAAHVVGPDGRIALNAKFATLAQLRAADLVRSEDLAGLLVFTVMRNPFDREVAIYESMRTNGVQKLDDPDVLSLHPRMPEVVARAGSVSFPEWLTHRYAQALPRVRRWRRRSVRRSRPPGTRDAARTADVVLRFEHLQADFDDLLARLGLDPIEIPRSNKINVRDYRTYYDARARRIVEDVYHYELDRFGYAF